MAITLTHILQRMVLSGDVPSKDVAKRIGKAYTTLLREINPHDNGAKVGVDSLLPIMRATGDDSPLHHLARELGYSLVRKAPEQQPLADPTPLLLSLLQGYGDFSRNIARVVEGEELSPEAVAETERAGQTAVMAILGFLEVLRATSAMAHSAGETEKEAAEPVEQPAKTPQPRKRNKKSARRGSQAA